MINILNETSIFVAYAHEDEYYRNMLTECLKPYERLGSITCWHDRLIKPGTKWGDEIDEHITSSDIIIALVSSSFLASDYCFDIELKTALKQHESGYSRLIPIIVRPVEWKDSPFSEIQALPHESKPISTWENEDQAWTNITKSIINIVSDITAQKSKFLGTSPFLLFAQYRHKKLDFLLEDDNPLNRNINRLSKKDAQVFYEFIDYRKQVINYISDIDKALSQWYQWVFNTHPIVLNTILPPAICDLGFKMSSIDLKELKLIGFINKLNILPELVGLRTRTEVFNENLTIMKLVNKILTSLPNNLHQMKMNILKPLQDLEEQSKGENFEDL